MNDRILAAEIDRCGKGTLPSLSVGTPFKKLFHTDSSPFLLRE
jgi:hypothetical protein